MKKIQSLSLFVVALLTLGSCTKFDDGPALSLLPAKARLTGEWELVDFSGQDAADYLEDLQDGSSMSMEFDRDGEGDFILTSPQYDYYFDYQTYQVIEVLVGTTTDFYNIEWDLDEEELEMQLYQNGEFEDFLLWEITRLTNSELEMTPKYYPATTYIFEKN